MLYLCMNEYGRREGDTPLTGTVRDVTEGVINIPDEKVLKVLNDAAHRADAQRTGEEENVIEADKIVTNKNIELLRQLLDDDSTASP